MDYVISGPMQNRRTDFDKELKNIQFEQALVSFLIDHLTTPEISPF